MNHSSSTLQKNTSQNGKLSSSSKKKHRGNRNEEHNSEHTSINDTNGSQTDKENNQIHEEIPQTEEAKTSMQSLSLDSKTIQNEQTNNNSIIQNNQSGQQIIESLKPDNEEIQTELLRLKFENQNLHKENKELQNQIKDYERKELTFIESNKNKDMAINDLKNESEHVKNQLNTQNFNNQELQKQLLKIQSQEREIEKKNESLLEQIKQLGDELAQKNSDLEIHLNKIKGIIESQIEVKINKLKRQFFSDQVEKFDLKLTTEYQNVLDSSFKKIDAILTEEVNDLKEKSFEKEQEYIIKLNHLELKVNVMEEEKVNLTSLKDQLEKDMVQLKEQLSNELNTKNTLIKELSQIQESHQSCQKDTQSLRQEKEEAERKVNVLEQDKNKLILIKDQLENEILQSKVQSDTNEKTSLERALSEIQPQLSSLQEDNNSLILQNKELERKVKHLEEEKNKLIVLKDEIQEESKCQKLKYDNENGALTKRLSELREKETSLQSEKIILSHQNKELIQEKDQLIAKINELTEQVLQKDQTIADSKLTIIIPKPQPSVPVQGQNCFLVLYPPSELEFAKNFIEDSFTRCKKNMTSQTFQEISVMNEQPNVPIFVFLHILSRTADSLKSDVEKLVKECGKLYPILSFFLGQRVFVVFINMSTNGITLPTFESQIPLIELRYDVRDDPPVIREQKTLLAFIETAFNKIKL